MATAADLTAAYVKQLTAHGELFSISDGTTTATALGRFLKPSDSELTDSIDYTTVRAVVMPPTGLTPSEGYTVTAGGRTFRITDVDDLSRRVAGTLIAYDLTLAG